MENRAPKGQRASWRLSVGPRSGDRGAKKFSMAVILPNPGTEGTAPSVDCEFPIRATVGQIKANLFANVPALFNLQRQNFVLALRQDIILDEEKRLVSAHEFIVQMFLKKEKIKVYLLPAANKALSFFGMDDSKRLSTSASPRTRAPSKGTQEISKSKTLDVIDLKLAVDDSNAKQNTIPAPTAVSPRSLKAGLSFNNLFRRGEKRTDEGSPLSLRKFTVSGHRTAEVTPPGSPAQRDPEVADVDSGVVLAGYLVKQGGNRKNWKKRWFVLTPTSLNYFNEKGDKAPIAGVLLIDILTVAAEAVRKENCFAVYTRVRTYFILANTQEEMVRWIDAIKSSINQIKSAKKLGGLMAGGVSKEVAAKGKTTELEHKLWEGWLNITPAARPKWRRQWCVLAINCIYYFRDPLNNKWQGKMSLEGCVVDFSTARQFCIAIMNHERTECLAADTEREMRELVAAIFKSRYRDNKETLKDPLEQLVAWSEKEVVVRKTVIPPVQLYNNPNAQIQKIRKIMDLVGRTSEDEESLFFRTKMSALVPTARLGDEMMINHVVIAEVINPVSRCTSLQTSTPLSLFFHFLQSELSASTGDKKNTFRSISISGGTGSPSSLSTSPVPKIVMEDEVIKPDDKPKAEEPKAANSPEVAPKVASEAEKAGNEEKPVVTTTGEEVKDAAANNNDNNNNNKGTTKQPEAPVVAGLASTGQAAELKKSSDNTNAPGPAAAVSTATEASSSPSPSPAPSALPLVTSAGPQEEKYLKISLAVKCDETVGNALRTMLKKYLRIYRKGGKNSGKSVEVGTSGELTFAADPVDAAREKTSPLESTDFGRNNDTLGVAKESPVVSEESLQEQGGDKSMSPKEDRKPQEVVKEVSIEQLSKGEPSSPTEVNKDSSPTPERASEPVVEKLAESPKADGERKEIEPEKGGEEKKPDSSDKEEKGTTTTASADVSKEILDESLYVLQVRGFREYILQTENIRLDLLKFVNDTTAKGEVVELLLVPREKLVKKMRDELDLQRKKEVEWLEEEDRQDEKAKPSSPRSQRDAPPKSPPVQRESQKRISPVVADLCKKFEDDNTIKYSDPRSLKGGSRKIDSNRTNPDQNKPRSFVEGHTTLPTEDNNTNTNNNNINTLPNGASSPNGEKRVKGDNNNKAMHMSGKFVEVAKPVTPSSDDVQREECYNIADLWDVQFTIKMFSIESVSDFFIFNPNATISIECGLYYGPNQMALYRTPQAKRPVWNSDNTFCTQLALPNLPREARACFRVLGHQGKDEWGLGWAHVTLFDHLGNLQFGRRAINLWPGDRPITPTAVVNPYLDAGHTLVLTVEFLQPPFNRKITYTFPTFQPAVAAPSSRGLVAIDTIPCVPPEEDVKVIERIVATDYLYELTPGEKQLLWKYRETCKMHYPQSLPKLLLSVDWIDRNAVAITHQLLKRWPRLDAVRALELLDYKYPDSWVRTFACNCLDALNDSEFATFLPQLIQACKFETYHSNALTQLLIRRALRSRLLIGQALFWELRTATIVEGGKTSGVGSLSDSMDASLEDEEEERRADEGAALRYALMGEVYLRSCGEAHRNDIFNQVALTDKLRAISDALKTIPKAQRDAFLQNALEEIQFPPEGITLPVDPRLRAKGLIIKKCKSMDSFTVPLWLVFENAEELGGPIRLMYKAGDDIRQDALTLQLIRVMDKLWKEAGLDLRMTPYAVLATGDKEGFIQIVENSETAARIQKIAGGASAVFNEKVLADWMRMKNPADRMYEWAVENFIYSCAGYCVACYILGIGDRHNDNIMLAKTGHMFHIDFAHFLGNVLKFGPIVRDKAPFVLTPEMAYVMGGRDSPIFKRFISLCCRAYNIIRTHANLFVALFAMMISSGIPQLNRKTDLDYLSKALVVALDEDEAAKRYTALIHKSLDTKMSQINFAVHILAHRD